MLPVLLRTRRAEEPASAVAYNRHESALCGVCRLSCAKFGGLHFFQEADQISFLT